MKMDILKILTCCVFVALTGCVSTKNAPELRLIQETEGFYTYSLLYKGSTSKYHYFDQETFIPVWWLLTDGLDHYRVPTTQLELPDGLERGYRLWGAEKNKVRISSREPYTVEPRKLWHERLHDRLRAEKQQWREVKEHYVQIGNSLQVVHKKTNNKVELPDHKRPTYEDGIRIIDIIQSYHEAHQNWPVSIDSLKAFDINSNASNSTVDWDIFENASFESLSDGYLKVTYKWSHHEVELGIAPAQ